MMFKNLLCSVEYMGSLPSQGAEFPHASEQLGPCVVTAEPHTTTRGVCSATKDSHDATKDPVCHN